MSKKIAAIGCALLLLTTTACSKAPDSPTPNLEDIQITEPVKVTEALTQPVMTDEPATPETTEPETVAPITEPEETQPETEPAQAPQEQSQTAPVSSSQQTTTSNKPQQSASSNASGTYTGDPYFEDFSSMPGWDDLLFPGDEGYEEAVEAQRNDEDREIALSLNTNNPELPFHVTLTQRTLEVGENWGVAFSYPGDASELTWTSSDPSVATVNQVGYVKPLKEGQTVVSVTDGSTTLTCKIIVTPATPEPPKLTDAEKEAAAREIAKKIAEQILSDGSAQTDLDRVRMATKAVFRYAMDGFTSSYHEDCRTAYGTLVAGYSNCVGTTKALGLVLEYMGYSWSHVNKNEWTHQWCEVYGVDGQTAYADASYNKSGYGQRPEVEDGIFYVEGSEE